MDKSERLQQTRLNQLVNTYGLPRLIITGFLIFLFIMAPVAGADFPTQITNVLNRFGWNAVLVLAMVPMVHSGCGLNFGIPLGILAGLLGATLSIQFGFTGALSFVMAIVISTPFAILFGGGYGALLNKIKGGEMMVATYVGFSSVSFMCIMWLMIPYTHPSIVMAYTGVGLRNMFSLDNFYANVLSDFLKIDLNPIDVNLVIPTGSLLFTALLFDVGLSPHQDGHRYDGRGLQPHLRQGLGHQCGPHPDAVRDSVHLAGCCGHSGLSAGLRLCSALYGALQYGYSRGGGNPHRRRVGE